MSEDKHPRRGVSGMEKEPVWGYAAEPPVAEGALDNEAEESVPRAIHPVEPAEGSREDVESENVPSPADS